MSAHSACVRNRKELLKKENVIGVGVGRKIRGGEKTDLDCVTVLVKKKLPLNQLQHVDKVPAYVFAAGEALVPTDVIETGVIKALPARKKKATRKVRRVKKKSSSRALDRTSRVRPAPGGVSIGHVDITAGTFGCMVTDGERNFILSNNHVLANSNNGKPGDPIFQPGTYDGGTSNDFIASLYAFKEISFGGGSGTTNPIIAFIKQLLCLLFGIFCDEEPGAENVMDAALGLPIVDEDVTPEIYEVGFPTGNSVAIVGDIVKKSGRTTGLTQGEVLVTDLTVQVQYGAGQVATFVDQVATDAKSAGGDSGSAFLNEQNQVVGLLFAGSDTVTIFSHIDAILNEFEVGIIAGA